MSVFRHRTASPSDEHLSRPPATTGVVSRPMRAPALYVTGPFTGTADASPGPPAVAPGLASVAPLAPPVARGTLVTLRLPLPPTWEGSVEGVAAAARRAHRAYLALLDAMQRGRMAPGQAAAQVGRLERFVADLRRESARAPLLHLLGIWRTVERTAGGAPLLRPPPPAPVTDVVVHVPPPPPSWGAQPAALVARFEARYAWPLEWLRARAYLAPRRDLRLEWRILEGA